ncbi:glutaredoxin family protein [Kurthia sibirica]|uniref:Thiol-disulfide isomerase n=1 Tax=Kurthia sibirica TaxID=202750 RepID=A0A2U3AI71_9BACL|nr:glutaredoxin family protein [Kurthia sibirica]PWI24207.1 thiol-disulfide isomerase [Kurthia sibirica]GEK34829.1 hypothetical protein KSI01_23620 [Kurthia sibirica]
MITYYSRPDCRLCEEGLNLLKIIQEERAFTIEIVNIEEDDALHEKYMMQIPVVEQNGQIVQSGLLDFMTLYEEVLAD